MKSRASLLLLAVLLLVVAAAPMAGAFDPTEEGTNCRGGGVKVGGKVVGAIVCDEFTFVKIGPIDIVIRPAERSVPGPKPTFFHGSTDRVVWTPGDGAPGPLRSEPILDSPR